MDQLLAVYTEIIRAASDDQIVTHLSNLVEDAAVLTKSIETVVAQARARTGQPEPTGVAQ